MKTLIKFLKYENKLFKILLYSTLLYSTLLLLTLSGCNDNSDEINSEFEMESIFFEHEKTNDSFKEYIIDYLREKNDSIYFTEQFLDIYGKPQWNIANSYITNKVSTLIVPILESNRKEISSLYFFICENNYLECYLLMNDSDDIAYKNSKYLIQYFEAKLGLKYSNPSFNTKLQEPDSFNNTKTARTTTIECWYYYSGTTEDPYMYYLGSDCTTTVTEDFISDRGGWTSNLTGGGSVSDVPDPSNGSGSNDSSNTDSSSNTTGEGIPLTWNIQNAKAKNVTNCSELNEITRKNWFNLTNGERIAHIIDAMRFENKNLQNNGYIDLFKIFDFGSISPTDNYCPEFAGRIIINGLTLEITVTISLTGQNTVQSDGSFVNLPDPFDADISGYHKTGYWSGYKFYTQNTMSGGCHVMEIDIKLGENKNDQSKAIFFHNSLNECN